MRSDDAATFESLVAYLSGDLDAVETARIDAGLADAPEQRAMLARLRGVLEAMRTDDSHAPTPAALRRALAVFDDAPAAVTTAEPSLLDEMVRIVARLVFDSRVQPATAGFRGGSDGITLGYDSDLGRIDLRIAETAGDGGSSRWRVRGQVRGSGGATAGAVALVASGTDEESVREATDDVGRFRVDADPGRYDLVVEFDDRRAVVVPELVLQ